ncbi:MAG: RDD family protein [Gammaproteobacteria bacterium]
MKPDSSPPPSDHTLGAAALWRRLAAIVYDTLLLAAVLMTATAVLLPLTGGEPIDGLARWPYRVYLLVIGCGFFAVFWHFGGQTLGMRAWRLQVRGANGPVSWREAWLRSLTALLSWLPLGLGYFWSIFDIEQRAWHDRLSGTRLLVIPKHRR